MLLCHASASPLSPQLSSLGMPWLGPFDFISRGGRNFPLYRHIMRELQGAIIVGSMFQCIMGFSGLMSFLLRLINPIVVAPTVAAVGLAFFSYGFPQAGTCLEISIPQIALVLIFTLYLRGISIFGRHVFRIYAVPLSVTIIWIYASFLTAGGAYNYKGCSPDIPSSNILNDACRRHAYTMKHCRTDVPNALSTAAWVRFPYPLQWGIPIFHYKTSIIMIIVSLVASVDSCDFQAIYASGIKGQAGLSPENLAEDLGPLFEAIVRCIPGPHIDKDGALQMLATNIEYDEHKGRIAIGRLQAGVLQRGMDVRVCTSEDSCRYGRISELFVYDKFSRVPAESVEAGDICAVCGIADIQIGETIADKVSGKPLPSIKVEEPTVKMSFSINISPFVGREGKYVTSRNLRDRLNRELERNLAMRVEDGETADTFIVSGRGTLHITILIENMRREGYEFMVGPPKVINKKGNDKLLEPYEVGTYHTASLRVNLRPPTPGVVSRGIALEGFCSILAGLWGSGTGSTTLTENAHTIEITKVANQKVVELGVAFLILLSFIASSGPFQSGLKQLDFAINAVMSMNMVVTLLVAFILDNTVPGSRQERGVYIWSQSEDIATDPSLPSEYSLPRKVGRCFFWAKCLGV